MDRYVNEKIFSNSSRLYPTSRETISYFNSYQTPRTSAMHGLYIAKVIQNLEKFYEFCEQNTKCSKKIKKEMASKNFGSYIVALDINDFFLYGKKNLLGSVSNKTKEEIKFRDITPFNYESAMEYIKNSSFSKNFFNMVIVLFCKSDPSLVFDIDIRNINFFMCSDRYSDTSSRNVLSYTYGVRLAVIPGNKLEYKKIIENFKKMLHDIKKELFLTIDKSNTIERRSNNLDVDPAYFIGVSSGTKHDKYFIDINVEQNERCEYIYNIDDRTIRILFEDKILSFCKNGDSKSNNYYYVDRKTNFMIPFMTTIRRSDLMAYDHTDLVYKGKRENKYIIFKKQFIKYLVEYLKTKETSKLDELYVFYKIINFDGCGSEIINTIIYEISNGEHPYLYENIKDVIQIIHNYIFFTKKSDHENTIDCKLLTILDDEKIIDAYLDIFLLSIVSFNKTENLLVLLEHSIFSNNLTLYNKIKKHLFVDGVFTSMDIKNPAFNIDNLIYETYVYEQFVKDYIDFLNTKFNYDFIHMFYALVIDHEFYQIGKESHSENNLFRFIEIIHQLARHRKEFRNSIIKLMEEQNVKETLIREVLPKQPQYSIEAT